MPRMITVIIPGFCESAIERLIEIMEAGLKARSSGQDSSRINADRKMVDYIISRLRSAK
jgi:hypothetical protein